MRFSFATVFPLTGSEVFHADGCPAGLGTVLQTKVAW